MIRQWSCDEHVKCVAYDTEVLPAGEEGADRGPFAAVLAASGTFQVRCDRSQRDHDQSRTVRRNMILAHTYATKPPMWCRSGI